MVQKLIDEDQIVDLDASKITSGVLNVNRIPNLPTSKITSGTFDNARISASNVTQHQSSINHDLLNNFVANEHVNHANIDIIAGAGLTGGGNITADRTLNVGAGTGITVNANDVEVDEGAVNHDNLSGFVGNEHINHASVTLTAGDGLTGGGNITTNRTFDVVGANSIVANANDIQLVNDQASPGNSKLYGTNGAGTKGWYDQPTGGGGSPLSGGTGFDAAFEFVDTLALPISTVRSVAHGLGAVPTLWMISLRCVIAEDGYSIGDEIQYTNEADNDNPNSFVDATNIGVTVPGQWRYRPKTGGDDNILTPANWRLVFRAWLGDGVTGSGGSFIESPLLPIVIVGGRYEVTWAHGLGSTPQLYWAYAVNNNAVNGYSPGDEFLLNWSSSGATSHVNPDATNLVWYESQPAVPFLYVPKTGSGVANAVAADWRIRFRIFEPEVFPALIPGRGFSSGQTWQQFTNPTRQYTTTYTNSEAYPICVQLTVETDMDTPGNNDAYIEVAPPVGSFLRVAYAAGEANDSSGSSDEHDTLTAIVPSGWRYRCSHGSFIGPSSGSAPIGRQWYELR